MKRFTQRNSNLIATAITALAIIGATNILLTAKAKADDINVEDLSLIGNVDNSGFASHKDIQREIKKAAGNSPALAWKNLNFKKTFGNGKYALTKILTHVTDITDSVEVLFTDTLPEISEPESVVTEYTSPINIAEENMTSSLVIPRLFEGNKGFIKNAAIPDAQVVYNFYLKPDRLIPMSDFRTPEGEYDLSTVTPTAFNPLAWLMSKPKAQKPQPQISAASADFVGPMPQTTAPVAKPPANQNSHLHFVWLNGTTLENTTLTARQPNNDTLTFDIKTVPVDAPTATSEFVLIYQKL